MRHRSGVAAPPLGRGPARLRRSLWGPLVSAPLLAAPLLWAFVAGAQERPSEDDLFGGSESLPAPSPPPAPEAPSAAPGAPPEPATPSRDDLILGETTRPMFTEEAAPEDPLTIGGQLYLRTQGTAAQGQRPGRAAFNAPSLLDVYLDARPNERLRAFVLTRVSYDPTLPARGVPDLSAGALPAGGSVAGAQELSALFASPTRGPHLVLDQVWVNFDIGRSVFVTAGTQHVRWGTGRFWAPTDYLHLRRRNPLDVFDARTGTAMLKLHVPIESKAWNFYGYAVTESETTTPNLESVAGALRAEFVLGVAELGLGAFARRGERPRFAADLSMGVGDVDVYSEVAVRDAGEIDRVHFAPDAEPPESLDPSAPGAALADLQSAIDAFYPRYRNHGYVPQVVAGLTYSRKYNDNDTFTLGAEYFYNPLGYGSAAPYPGLVLPRAPALQNPATFFYLGKVYGAVFITFPAPFSLDNHTFTLSTLGNLSDRSFITRLDYALIALTHLRFEAFVSGHYGHENGEFRFGTQQLSLGEYTFSRAPALLDFGLALRVAM